MGEMGLSPFVTTIEQNKVNTAFFCKLIALLTRGRRLLLVGYVSGLQAWDCTNLDAVNDVLNLRWLDWGRPWSAAILTTPKGAADEFAGVRPLIGMM